MQFTSQSPNAPARLADRSRAETTLVLADFRVSVLSFSPVRLEPHYHDRACLSVILEGAFTKRFAREEVECVAGSSVVMPVGERHVDIMYGSRQTVIEPDLESPHDPRMLEAFDQIRLVRNPQVLGAASRIESEMRARDRWTSLAVEGLVLEMVAALGRSASSRGGNHRVPAWLGRVQERLTLEETAPTLSELGVIAGVHPKHLNRVFRRNFGSTIGEYARRIRVERAALELARTSTPIAAIALRAGFADQSHFTRVFRRAFGTTPGVYRARASYSSRSA